MGLMTTTVGSFPKPVELLRARWRFTEGEIDRAALAAAEERALGDVLRLQESLQLDLLVDGQLDRGDMLSFFAERLDGVDVGDLVRCYGNRYYRKPRVVGPIERPEPLTVERWKQVQGRCARPVRAILTGPYTLMDWSHDEYYLSREKCCFAFTEVVRQEAQELAEAGATEIQLDEIAIGARPGEMDLVAEALARVARAVEGRARVWIHVAYGDPGPITRQVLDLPVDVILLELANSDLAALDSVRDLPEGRVLGAGVVDVTSPRVETAEEIRGRIERVLERVPRERLWVVPDAGLRALATEQAEAKLRAMAEAVASLR